MLVVIAYAEYSMYNMPPAATLLRGRSRVVVLARDEWMVVVLAKDDRALSSSPRTTGFYFWKKIILRSISGIK